MGDLTHLDEEGEAKMVDVGDKETTRREATARGFVYVEQSTLETIAEGKVEKGEVAQIARIAGIDGAKKTSDLVPLCHPLFLDHVAVEIDLRPEAAAVEIRATVRCEAQTGAEMEALSAVSTAALTVYDMCKSMDAAMSIGDIHLVEKTGGSSGDFEHPNPPGPSATHEGGETDR
ncbi:MAG: cyclic pyranopterin monophosphate synthase MoaC [Bradymonadaceae bacterium]